MTPDDENQVNVDRAPTKTERFATWLMEREERRQEKDSNIEGLIKINVMVSFLTLGLVGGFEAARFALTMIPYL